jgi:hypothetical protein
MYVLCNFYVCMYVCMYVCIYLFSPLLTMHSFCQERRQLHENGTIATFLSSTYTHISVAARIYQNVCRNSPKVDQRL